MRAQAWEPRSVRARFRQILLATSELERELGRAPTAIEVATRVGITVEEVTRCQQALDAARATTLSVKTDGDEGAELSELVASRDLGHAGHEMTELSASVATAITPLPEQDRLLFAWVYAQRMPFKDIAQTLGVTESWPDRQVMPRWQCASPFPGAHRPTRRGVPGDALGLTRRPGRHSRRGRHRRRLVDGSRGRPHHRQRRAHGRAVTASWFYGDLAAP